MSHTLCGVVRLKDCGSMIRKAMLGALADRAGDDGRDIFASVALLAALAGCGERGAHTTLRELERDGLIRRVGKRPGRHGATIIYEINLVALEALPDITKPPNPAPRADNEPYSARGAPQTLHHVQTNQSLEPVRDSSAAADRPLDRCLAVAGPGLADPAKTPNLHLTAHRIAAAIAAGCDLEADLLPVIAARTAKPRASPITTWGYFDRAWADARDQRLAGFAPADPSRFIGEHHAPRASPANGGGGIIDAALRLADRERAPDRDADGEPDASPQPDRRLIGPGG